MPLLDQPFGWTWLLVIGWTGYRLLSSLVLAFYEAAHLGQKKTSGIFLFHMIGSLVIFAIFGAAGWRMIAGPKGAGFTMCFGAIGGLVGLIVGLVVDMVLVLRVQHRIAVAIVAGKAARYAEMLDLGDSEQRVRAAIAMAFIGPKALFAIPQLLNAWKDRDADLRYRVAIAFGCTESEEPEVIAAMQSGLQDSDPRVRVVAAWVLVKRKIAEPDAVVPILRTGLTQEEDVKNLALDALAELGPDAAPAIPELIAMIDDTAKENFAARWVLAKIGPPAVPALIPLLKSDSRKVRVTAIDALAEIGPAAREALPALQELQSESDRNIRSSASMAIAKILEGKS